MLCLHRVRVCSAIMCSFSVVGILVAFPYFVPAPGTLERSLSPLASRWILWRWLRILKHGERLVKCLPLSGSPVKICEWIEPLLVRIALSWRSTHGSSCLHGTKTLQQYFEYFKTVDNIMWLVPWLCHGYAMVVPWLCNGWLLTLRSAIYTGLHTAFL